MGIIGGTYTAQDKILPGVYVNIKTAAAQAGTRSERGVVAVPIVLNWGPSNQVISVTAEEFRNNSMQLFGYSHDAPQLLALREVFIGAARAYFYRVTAEDAAAASNTFATAKYTGTRGNDIKIVITADVDNEGMYKVSTFVGSKIVNVQTVAKAAELKENEFVTFKEEATLSETAGEALTGGTDGASVTVAQYQDFLDSVETRGFNVLCCPSNTAEVKALFAAYGKRMRLNGATFQTVLYKDAADYEGCINVTNAVKGFKTENLGIGEYGLVYWTAGITAGCALNRSNTNRVYDGQLTVDASATYLDLTRAIEAGEFRLHEVAGEMRVLEDLNSLVSFTEERGSNFRYNQTVRAVDQLVTDIGMRYESDYKGKIANSETGRLSLWNDICKIIQGYVNDGVFSDFSTDIVSVQPGDATDAVQCSIGGLTVAYTMAKLYINMQIW